MSLVPNVELKLFCIPCSSFAVWGCPWALELLLVQPRLGHQDAFIWSFCDPARIKGRVTGLMTQFLFGLGSLSVMTCIPHVLRPLAQHWPCAQQGKSVASIPHLTFRRTPRGRWCHYPFYRTPRPGRVGLTLVRPLQLAAARRGASWLWLIPRITLLSEGLRTVAGKVPAPRLPGHSPDFLGGARREGTPRATNLPGRGRT